MANLWAAAALVLAAQAPAPAPAPAAAPPPAAAPADAAPPPAEAPAPSAAPEPKETVVITVSDDVFEDGVRAFDAGDFETAAEKMWHYIKGSEQTADHYEWAELYLARSFLALEFTHAGVEYLYNVAKERKRPELLPEALKLLEDIRESRPYDDELVDLDLIAGSDFGALPPNAKSFVEYQQGRVDLVDGHPTWAQRHFERLKKSGDDDARVQRYALRARVATALADLRDTHAKDSKAKREKRESALKQLEEVVAVEEGEASVKNDARRVLAAPKVARHTWTSMPDPSNPYVSCATASR